MYSTQKKGHLCQQPCKKVVSLSYNPLTKDYFIFYESHIQRSGGKMNKIHKRFQHQSNLME